MSRYAEFRHHLPRDNKYLSRGTGLLETRAVFAMNSRIAIKNVESYVMCVTAITRDKHVGEVVTGAISGRKTSANRLVSMQTHHGCCGCD